MNFNDVNNNLDVAFNGGQKLLDLVAFRKI